MSPPPCPLPSPRVPLQSFWHDPALPFVESRRACHSRACYRPHVHPTLSVGAVDAGYSRFSSADTGAVPLVPGTLVVVPAGRVHACNPAVGHAWSYQMLHLDLAWVRALRDEHPRLQGLRADTVRILPEAALYRRFCALNALLFDDSEPAAHKEAALVEFIGDLEAHPGGGLPLPARPAHLHARIRPALDRLQAEPATSHSLANLAHLCGLSRYQTVRAFRAVTGLPPHAWQLNHRINLAREALRRGAALSDIALQLGFADQAHFQRVFKAHTGTTPARFRD